jgi:hypothetical protein
MEHDCHHTPGVICNGRDKRCERCGWYPQEAERRKKMIADGQMSTGAWGRKWFRIKKKIG